MPNFQVSFIQASWDVLHQQKSVLHIRFTLTLLNHQVLATWNKREGDLIAANKLDRIVAQVRRKSISYFRHLRNGSLSRYSSRVDYS